MILTQNVSKQTQGSSLCWSSSVQVQIPPADSRSAACMLTLQFTAGCSWVSVVWGELFSHGEGCRRWPTNGTYIQEEEVATLRVMNHSAQHTRNSSKWKQRAQGADFGYFCSVSLSALWDSSLPLGTSLRPVLPYSLNRCLSKCQSHSNPNYNLPVQQSSKPQPRFSCL